MLNDILLQTSSGQGYPLSLHLLNNLYIDGNSPVLKNFFVLSGCFLSMRMSSPQKKTMRFSINFVAVFLIAKTDEDFH